MKWAPWRPESNPEKPTLPELLALELPRVEVSKMLVQHGYIALDKVSEVTEFLYKHNPSVASVAFRCYCGAYVFDIGRHAADCLRAAGLLLDTDEESDDGNAANC